MTVPKAPRSVPPGGDISPALEALSGVGGPIGTLAGFGLAAIEGVYEVSAEVAGLHSQEAKDQYRETMAPEAVRKKQQARAVAEASKAAAFKAQQDQYASLGEAIDRLSSGPFYLGESFRIHAERNADGVERLFFQVRTADKWESFLSLDDSGAMKLKGALTQDTTFDTEGEEPQ